LGAVKYLSVKEKFRRQGFGTILLHLAEKQSRSRNIRILQSTVRKENDISIKCFEKSKWNKVMSFFNSYTEKELYIFQKNIIAVSDQDSLGVNRLVRAYNIPLPLIIYIVE